MNIPDHFSESLDSFVRLTILKFFDTDPVWDLFDTINQGSAMEKFGSGIRYKHPGSATLVPISWRPVTSGAPSQTTRSASPPANSSTILFAVDSFVMSP
jgi:hypothetical protein